MHRSIVSPLPASPNRRRFLKLTGGALGATLAAPALLRAETSPLETIAGTAFATYWRLSVPSGRDAGRLRGRIEAALAEIDHQMSPWRADSDVCRFNAAAEGAVAMPGETVSVTAAALAIAKASDGRFDPTVGPLVARWGFGPIEKGAPPDWHKIGLAGDHIVKHKGGLTLDLCGIAKGYALDRMLAIASEAGHDDLLIDLGGELAAKGRHPSGRDWYVAVEDPRPGASGVVAKLRLNDTTVATSGGHIQSYELDGRRYSHIIDPATGEPVAGGLLSVSVLAPRATEADGWATALAAAGPIEGPALARKNGIAALFLRADGVDIARETTGGFETHLL